MFSWVSHGAARWSTVSSREQWDDVGRTPSSDNGMVESLSGTTSPGVADDLWSFGAVWLCAIGKSWASEEFTARSQVELRATGSGASLAGSPFSSWSNSDSVSSSNSSHGVGSVTVVVIGLCSSAGGFEPSVWSEEIVAESFMSSTDSSIDVSENGSGSVGSSGHGPNAVSFDFQNSPLVFIDSGPTVVVDTMDLDIFKWDVDFFGDGRDLGHGCELIDQFQSSLWNVYLVGNPEAGVLDTGFCQGRKDVLLGDGSMIFQGGGNSVQTGSSVRNAGSVQVVKDSLGARFQTDENACGLSTGQDMAKSWLNDLGGSL